MTSEGEVEAKRRELARALNCATDKEVQTLARVNGNTTAAWRKRGTGPEYLRFGNEFLYPIPGLAEHMQRRVRKRNDDLINAKDLL